MPTSPAPRPTPSRRPTSTPATSSTPPPATPSPAPRRSTPTRQTVTIYAHQTRGITIVKSSDATPSTTVGDVITYSYLVTNTGNTTISGLLVIDAHVGLSLISCGGVTTLGAGASVTCTATYTVTQGDVDTGSITNTGTASGTTVLGDVSASHEITVTLTQTHSVTIVKSSNATVNTGAGDVITYSYLVTNTGNVTISGLLVIDAHVGLSLISCGGVTTWARVPASPAPRPTRSPRATWTPARSPTPAASMAPPSWAVDASHEITVTLTQTHGVTIVKSSDATVSTTVGDTITYSYLVTNTGNVTITGLLVVNSQLGPVTCTVTLAGHASVTCTATHVVTQAEVDAGSITNTGSVSGHTAIGDVSASHEITVTLTRSKGVTIVKSSDATPDTGAGDIITYSYLVTNTGNVTITGLLVADPQLGPVTCTATLAGGASVTCTATYVVTQADVDAGSITNTGTVTGTTTAGDVSASHEITVTLDPDAAAHPRQDPRPRELRDARPDDHLQLPAGQRRQRHVDGALQRR